MASLITLAVAKMHLGITDDLSNADIEMKIEQASDIILGYLRGRPIPVSSLVSSAGVATVTTPTVHGLTSLDVVTVRGADQAEYNGSFTVTVLTTTTVTFPISGSPAATATGAIGMRTAYTWAESTVPKRVQAATCLMLTHVYERRGDDPESDAALWTAVERLLARDRDPAMA